MRKLSTKSSKLRNPSVPNAKTLIYSDDVLIQFKNIRAQAIYSSKISICIKVPIPRIAIHLLYSRYMYYNLSNTYSIDILHYEMHFPELQYIHCILATSIAFQVTHILQIFYTTSRAQLDEMNSRNFAKMLWRRILLNRHFDQDRTPSLLYLVQKSRNQTNIVKIPKG